MEILRPAQLDYFAIYSPALGPTDETLPDQLVYYHSQSSKKSQDADDKTTTRDVAKEERNEQLRNIGLAQGMVSFAQAFSDGENVDFIDSEKSRILLNEIESGWWVLVSVNLTQLQTTTVSSSSKGKAKSSQTKIEYSGREVSPHGLLLRQVLDAHSVFLLHHGVSLAEIYKRLKRPKFCAALERFWNGFLRNWDVLLHGSPAVDVFHGIKLAAGGELGIGVGEEEWGSGEREVLEDYTRRTNGLVDILVSRFGAEDTNDQDDESQRWLGSGRQPSMTDGLIYSGTSQITRHSLVAVSKWVEWIYKNGPSTYGVQDNPHAPKRRRRKENAKSQQQTLDAWPTGIPSPLFAHTTNPTNTAPTKVDTDSPNKSSEKMSADASTNMDVLMKYATFGIYGSGWGLPSKGPISKDSTADGKSTEPNESKKNPDGSTLNAPSGQPDITTSKREAKASFLVGLQGDLDDEGMDDTDEDSDQRSGDVGLPRSSNRRIQVRTLYIGRQPAADDADSIDTTTSAKMERMQVIIYINQPFIFTFLFELNVPTLGYTSFYRSIDHQLGPLRKSLLRSTSLDMIRQKLSNAISVKTVSSVESKQPIYDLVYDPINLTIHTNIPSIPDAHDLKTEWSRLDALNVHSQIVVTRLASNLSLSMSERSAKTSRGWWVVWIKFPPGEQWQSKEAFLVRKASDYVEDGKQKASTGFGKDIANLGSSAGRVAEGIGIDARRYVEGLISFSR